MIRNNELAGKIEIIKDSCKAEDRENLYKLLEMLSDSAEEMDKVAELILEMSDDLSEELADTFVFLCYRHAVPDIYRVCGMISEEPGTDDYCAYKDALHNCVLAGLDADTILNLFGENKSAATFKSAVEEYIDNNDCDIDAENDTKSKASEEALLKSNEKLSLELADMVNKLSTALDNASHYHLEYTKLKIAYDRLLKNSEKTEIELKISAQKVLKLSDLVKSLKEINKAQNESSKPDDSISEKLNAANEEIESLNEENKSLTNRIEELEAELLKINDERENATDPLEKETDKKKTEEKPEQLSQENIDLEENKEGLNKSCRRIINNYSEITEQASLFSKIMASHYEKAFEKQPDVNQITMIKAKMLEVNMEKEKLLLLRTIMSAKKVPLLDIYKLVLKNPSMEDIQALRERF